MHYLLNLLIWLPIIGGVFVLLAGDDRNPNISRYFGFIYCSIILLLCVPLVSGFDTQLLGMQFLKNIPGCLHWVLATV